ncbi:amino-acid N-acetyltransferase [Saccharobesus litoralis]|uniref:Amino-acid acetyltransferase n=1 Tax=Saccharobesus litoralis TaxID=2172099 RepID=A0A2S0VQJ7_9ALTE|nr:amino-acid N-acetyltransferase [Saccharobesus litoralis]AWB66487.1 amino-acid N-acetyltransferase [Saccharobesus litoralis]
MENADQNYVKWFRNAAPYINAHRGKTFVMMFGGEAVQHPNFSNIIHDIALLRSLGVKLVLIHGARPQIDARLEQRGLEQKIEHNIRITDTESLSAVIDATGSLRIHIESLLTMGLINSPMHGAQIRVSSGNFVIAKPIGVLNGVDYKHTGEVRRVDSEGISRQLKDESIVLISTLGYSSTGEVFNLSLEDVATQTANALKADKLITFSEFNGLIDSAGELIRSCDLNTVHRLLNQDTPHPQRVLLRAILNCSKAGVERCHSVSFSSETALLQELFTRDGAGTMVSKDYRERISVASIDDVGGILDLIAPLEENGTLVKRSRELLENEISQFTVIKKEDVIIACAALYPYPEAKTGEVACVVIHPEYRGGNRGQRLLDSMEAEAKKQGLESIFVLTTVSAHWFIEQGFVEQPISRLPEGKQQMYNFQRKSKVFMKQI